MIDQATRLRQMVKGIKEKTVSEVLSETSEGPQKNARIITVTSGKGGVGKTNFTANLALALAQMDRRVLIFDADFGLANVDVVLGRTSKYDLSAVIKDNKSIDDIVEAGPLGVQFISGGSGVYELLKMDSATLGKLVEALKHLENDADIMLFDTGAGISDNIIKLVAASDEIIIVITPEPTSIMDAYALVKTIVRENCETQLKIVVNRCDSKNEGDEMMEKFSNVVSNYLGIKVTKLGTIVFDQAVVAAVKKQTPFLLSSPNSLAAKNISEIARTLVNLPAPPKQVGLRGFLNRFLR